MLCKAGVLFGKVLKVMNRIRNHDLISFLSLVSTVL